MADLALTRLGRYRILSELGRGAMGVVYRGEDPLLSRTVAIKTIVLSADEQERAEYEARFYQEARAAGSLNHPNLITIYDIGREDGTAYMAMELLDGVELREMMKRSRVPLPLALEIIAQVAEGLAFAHQHGVVHRDIKPANIMVIRNRHAKIMDFGIARVRVSDIETQAGAVLGSPKYMSPEQVTGQRADHRSDIFSLGIVLHELVCGTPPFSAPTVPALMHAITVDSPQPPSAVDRTLPGMLDLIVAKALAKEPDARYQDAAQIAADLRACLAQRSDTAAAMTIPPAAAIRIPSPDIAPDARTIAIEHESTVMSEATQVAGHASLERTRSSDAVSGTRIEQRGVMPLYPSRAFDSDAAMQWLATPASDGAQGTAGTQTVTRAGSALRYVWENPDRRIFAVAMLIAAACAALIALF